MKYLLTHLFILRLVSCGNKSEPPPEKPKIDPDAPRLVGRIASIPKERKFVLIQSYGSWNVATGSVLTTQGPDGRAANLLATGEKLGQYAAADLRSGTLEVGDGVYTAMKVKEQENSKPPEKSKATPEEAEPEEVKEPEPEPSADPDPELKNSIFGP